MESGVVVRGRMKVSTGEVMVKWLAASFPAPGFEAEGYEDLSALLCSGLDEVSCMGRVFCSGDGLRDSVAGRTMGMGGMVWPVADDSLRQRAVMSAP